MVMKGLLLKDFYVLSKQLKLFLVMMVVFSIIPGGYLSAFAIMYASMMPITTIGYDERSKWKKMASMMPYGKEELVMSKYIVGYVVTFGMTIIAMIARTVYGIIEGTDLIEGIGTLYIVFLLAAFVEALNLPIILKLGVEKGRMLFVLITVVFTVGVTGLIAKANLDISIGLFLIIATVVIAIANLISIKISIRVYNNEVN